MGMSMFPKCRDEVVQFMIERFGISPGSEWVDAAGEATGEGGSSSRSGSMVYHMDEENLELERMTESMVFVIDPNGEEPVQEIPGR